MQPDPLALHRGRQVLTQLITSKIADLAGLAIGIGAAAVLLAGALAVVRKAIATEAR